MVCIPLKLFEGTTMNYLICLQMLEEVNARKLNLTQP